MTSYRVVPQKGKWAVMTASSNSAKHRKVSQHMTKQNAKDKARRLASSGDRLVIVRSDGAIQSSVKVQ